MISDINIHFIGPQSDIMRVTIHGSLDTMFAYHFQEQVEKTIAQGQRKYLIDLEEAEYISSAGIGVLSAFLLGLQRHHGLVRFIHVPDNILEIVHLTNLIQIFPLADSQEKAIQELEDEM